MNRKDRDILKRDIAEITQYAQEKKSDTMPEWMVQYLDWMEKARDWFYKNHSKKYVINMLIGTIKKSDGKEISQYVAEKVFADAMNFFYANRSIRKQAWRNILAEKLYLAAISQFNKGDEDGFGKNIERMKFFLELDKPDDEGIDPRLLDRRPVVYFTNPEDLGIERTSRNELARLIDGYDIREKEKARIRREAGIGKRQLFEERNIIDVKAIEEEGNAETEG